MNTLADFAAVSAAASGLAVTSTFHGELISSSVVSVGLLPHPLTGQHVVGLVARSDSRKLMNLRHHPRATLTAVTGYRWVTVEGPVTLIGPDDKVDGFDPAGIGQLLRDVFTAAGGQHENWDQYDQAMAEERRTAVLVTPARVYSNPGT